MPAPEYIQLAVTSKPVFNPSPFGGWNDSKETPSVPVLAGDFLVACIVGANATTEDNWLSNFGDPLTWAMAQNSDVETWCDSEIQYATVGADGSVAIKVNHNDPSDSDSYGAALLVFRNSGGVGASAVALVDAAAPALDFTTTQPDSAIVVVSLDKTAVDGAVRTWRENAGPVTELVYYLDPLSRYTVYIAIHPGPLAVGTYTVGLDDPAVQRFTIAAFEVLGTPDPDPPSGGLTMGFGF